MIRIFFAIILFSLSCEGIGDKNDEIILSSGEKNSADLMHSHPIYWDGNADMYSKTVIFMNQAPAPQ